MNLFLVQVQYKGAYEPYYVVNKSETPIYPEEFLYKYSDKRAHADLLHKLGYGHLSHFFVSHILFSMLAIQTYMIYLCHISQNKR